MVTYDKLKIKESILDEQVFDLLLEFGGDPSRENFGFVSTTICHNQPGEGSRKLYYYFNSQLFKCYTGCPESFFDIFELVIKVANIQWEQEYDLNDAVRWVAQKLGISGDSTDNSQPEELDDWKYLANYERIQEIEVNTQAITLKEYENTVLDHLDYKVRLAPWLNEGISQEILTNAKIGYYPGGGQITIPHFDLNNRFIGLRGRSLCSAEAERYGKYRPLKVNQLLYSHPLGMNLYNLNNSKKNIAIMKKAIVFESEKSTLLYQTYFGKENDISVACCGSSLSAYQVQMLIDAGAEEIVIAFDRQFKTIGDEEFQHLKNNLLRIRNRYKNYATISFIFDKNMITKYKSSPIDESKEKFLQLFKERIIL